jgi:hypothetical protein
VFLVPLTGGDDDGKQSEGPTPGKQSLTLTSALRTLAGAEVASRRKAQRGSSQTVFREGNRCGPGDPAAPADTY